MGLGDGFREFSGTFLVKMSEESGREKTWKKGPFEIWGWEGVGFFGERKWLGFGLVGVLGCFCGVFVCLCYFCLA